MTDYIYQGCADIFHCSIIGTDDARAYSSSTTGGTFIPDLATKNVLGHTMVGSLTNSVSMPFSANLMVNPKNYHIDSFDAKNQGRKDIFYIYNLHKDLEFDPDSYYNIVDIGCKERDQGILDQRFACPQMTNASTFNSMAPLL